MEDAHAAVLDLQPEEKGKSKQSAAPDKRLSYFGVYDGHGGEKVAQFAGENIHKIVAKQDAFSKGDIEQALKDGFLATDRAILNGMVYPAITRSCHTKVILQMHGMKMRCPDVPRLSASYPKIRSGWCVKVSTGSLTP